MDKPLNKCLYCNGNIIKDNNNLKCNNINCQAGEFGYKRFIKVYKNYNNKKSISKKEIK